MRAWTRRVPRSRGKSHIAILDDEEAIVFSLTRIMRRAGYSAAGFTNSEDARLGLERRAPDLLMSDIAMPDISGIEFAIQATERFPDCKVLLFSARLDAHAMVEDMKRHGYAFTAIMKPVDPKELLDAVRQLLAPQADTTRGRERHGIFAFPPPIRQA